MCARVVLSKAAMLNVVLLGTDGKRVARWSLKVKGGSTPVTLKLPSKLVLKTGRYTLVWAAHADGQTITQRTVFTIGPTLGSFGWQPLVVADRPRKSPTRRR